MKRKVFAFFYSVQKFCCFFHDGKVSGEVHIVNAVKAEALDCGNHFAFCVNTGFIAEAFADGGTDGGCCADGNVLGGVVERFPNLSGVVLFVERTNGAGNDTLAAGYAGGCSEGLFKCGADASIKATVDGFDRADALHILTSRYTTTAEDTFVVVTNEESGAFVFFVFIVFAFEAGFVCNTEIVAKLLELTAVAADTGETFSLMCGEDELEVGLSGFNNLGGVCPDFHAVGYGCYAGSHKTSGAFHFNKAKTASADLVYVLEIAKGGDINFCDSCGIDDLDTRRDFIFTSVDFNGYSFH